MSVHIRRELHGLRNDVLSLGARVVVNLQNATRSLLDAGADLTATVIANDHLIDQLEVTLEEECLKVLALHQPVAVDLRYIVSILKINNDLERIGDLAVNISKKANYLKSFRIDSAHEALHLIAEITREMFKLSLDSLVHMDTALARRVCDMDDEVDERHKDFMDWVEQQIREDADNVNFYLRLIGISRNLERIADHATNIAEDSIYLSEGEIVRHRTS